MMPQTNSLTLKELILRAISATLTAASFLGIGYELGNSETANAPPAPPAATQIQDQSVTPLATAQNISLKSFNSIAPPPQDYVTCKCFQRRSDGKVICWGHVRHPGNPPPGMTAPFKCYKDQP